MVSQRETEDILSDTLKSLLKCSPEKDVSKDTFIRTGHFFSNISPISEILE